MLEIYLFGLIPGGAVVLMTLLISLGESHGRDGVGRALFFTTVALFVVLLWPLAVGLLALAGALSVPVGIIYGLSWGFNEYIRKDSKE